jgi:hypothetical protein
MAEFQWWLLIVGLVAGGGLVAVVMTNGRRREEDLADLERRAEATWIAERLSGRGRTVDRPTVDAVLRLHREYLSLPPPDEIVVAGAVEETVGEAVPGGANGAAPELDRDPDADDVSDEVRDDGRRSADEDLART